MDDRTPTPSLPRRAGGGSEAPELAAGLAHLRARRWYEAHEALEAAWVAEPQGPRRDALRGLVNGAVALVHLQRGNRIGARLQATKCAARLAAHAGALGPALGARAAAWSTALTALVAAGTLPAEPGWPSI